MSNQHTIDPSTRSKHISKRAYAGCTNWERMPGNRSIRRCRHSYIYAVVSLKRNKSNKIDWIVTNTLIKKTEQGQERSIECAIMAATAHMYLTRSAKSSVKYMAETSASHFEEIT